MKLTVRPVVEILGLALTATMAVAQAAPPQFDLLFTGFFSTGSQASFNTFNGPFGTRLGAPIASGNFSDPSGKLVANIVPGTSADHGLSTPSGLIFPDARITIQWTDDSTFAFLQLYGVGVPGSPSNVYVHFETDTNSTHSSLISQFVIGNLEFVQPTVAQANFYSLHGNSTST